MRWKWLLLGFLRDGFWTSCWSVALSLISSLPLWFCALVLFVLWPVVGLGQRTSEPHVPTDRMRIFEPRNIRIRAIQIAIVLVVSVLVWFCSNLSFGNAFTYTFLIMCAVAAVNGAIIDWEDNQPGGWLNPKP